MSEQLALELPKAEPPSPGPQPVPLLPAEQRTPAVPFGEFEFCRALEPQATPDQLATGVVRRRRLA